MGLQAYLPSKAITLLSEAVNETLVQLTNDSVKKQLIGSLSSVYAIDQKIIQLKENKDFPMVEYAEKHKQSILNSK